MTMITRPHRLATAALIGTVASLSTISAFVAPSRNVPFLPQTSSPLHHNDLQRTSASALSMAAGDPFEIMVELPGEGLSAQMKFPPVLDVPSEMIEVRYKLPFGLDVEPKNNLATCTKDGPGGEKVGDILRYTSQWTMGLPRGNGAITTAASFSGAISWQVSMFDVARAEKWEYVIEALVSNDPRRTDEVVLLFERPLPEVEE
ncbi:hypothetical protein ACHAXR_003766 [Thalassiosira sp. AJA248-18]